MYSNQVRQRIRGLVAGVGPSIATNPDQLEAKLADLASDSPEDVRLIVAAAKGGVAEEIAAAAPEQRAELVEQASAWMASESGVSPEAARWAVETWSMALEGVQTAPAPAAPAAAQAPAPAWNPTIPRAPTAPPLADTAPPAPWDAPRGAPPPPGPWGAPPQPAAPWNNPGNVAPPPGTFPPPAGYPGNRYPGPPGGSRYYTQTVNAGQILAMGIIAFFCFGIILGPIAWVQGNNALGQIDDGYADPSQRGTVLAGRTCGIIATILNVIWLIVWLIDLAAFHASYR